MAARKLERERARVERDAQEAVKKAQRKEEAIQMQAAKQLQDEVKSTNQKQPSKGKKKVQFDIVEGSDSGAVCEQEAVSMIMHRDRYRLHLRCQLSLFCSLWGRCQRSTYTSRQLLNCLF